MTKVEPRCYASRLGAEPRHGIVAEERTAEGDSGYAIALTALLLIPLIGFMALAIDVGAWYAQATSVQRAADAAALSSVVWMPDIDKARIVAADTIARNGIDMLEEYEHPTDGPMPRWEVTLDPLPSNRFQVRVVITDNTAPIYFGSLFLDRVDITRQAVAEFVKPVPLGSPGNTLGIICDESVPAICTTGAPGYWLRNAGVNRPHEHGDYRSVGCINNTSCDPYDNTDPDRNPGFDTGGYVYAIEVQTAGTWVTVDIFDPGYSPNRDSPAAWDQGDDPDMPTKYTLYEADGSLLTTPLTTEVGGGCTKVYGIDDTVDQWSGATCHFYADKADVYPLQVQTSGFPTADGASESTNTFSLRAYTGLVPPAPGVTAGHPLVYAIDFMSIGSRSNTTVFDLARIDPAHKGKVMSIQMWDIGDGSGELIANFVGPYGIPSTCRYRSWDPESLPVDAWTTLTSGCSVVTKPEGSPSLFNDKWLEVQIDLPETYSCTGDDCYWQVDYSATEYFGEGTTWAVSILGDPVRLVG